MISPWEDRYQRPRLRRLTREFKLPDGRQWRLTLEEADIPALGLIADQSQELMTRYIGSPRNPAPPVVLPNGRRLRPSRALCQSVAELMVLQRPEEGDAYPEGDGALSFLDWVGVMMQWPEVWVELQGFILEASAPAEEAEGAGDPPSPTGTGAGSA